MHLPPNEKCHIAGELLLVWIIMVSAIISVYLHIGVFRINAVIPFLIVIVVTFVGMILSGYFSITANNDQATNEEDK